MAVAAAGMILTASTKDGNYECADNPDGDHHELKRK